MLFRIVLIQHIYGIRSLRRTLEEISMNTEAIFVDGTHIKASASFKKQARKAVPKEAKRYAHELLEEINKDRESHGKQPFDDDNNKEDAAEPETVEKTVSATDPECGVFHKGEHKKVFAYEAHTACDKHNFILGVHVTPGNIHDSVAFDPLYDDICPEYKALHYSTTNRDGYREYKSRSYLCNACPTRAMCIQSAKCEKTVTRHIWQRFVEMTEDVRHTPLYRDIYKLRQQKIERVFADAKEKHGMRYTQYRGLAQVTNWVKLKFSRVK